MKYNFPKKTVKDIDVHAKRVILRADFNVPLDEKGKITSDYRIVKTLPTIKYLLAQNAEVVIISHLGRPDGQKNLKYSLKSVAKRLAELLDHPVAFIEDCIGDQVTQCLKNKSPRKVTLLENIRFYAGEEEGDNSFAQQLKMAVQPDVMVQDAFGAAHRAHASVTDLAHQVPAVAGLLLAAEVTTLCQAISNPKKPLVAVVGGAKVSDKIEMLERFIELADALLIGGAMANTFFEYLRLPIGKSVWEPDQHEVIEKIKSKINRKKGQPVLLSDNDFFILPTDVVVAREKTATAPSRVTTPDGVRDGEYMLDIGPRTQSNFQAVLATAGTVVWNGTLGYAEVEQFQAGSAAVATSLKKLKGQAETIIGGGDTADFALQWDKKGNSFNHISTGGGASLELLSGKKLPGVEVLLNR